MQGRLYQNCCAPALIVDVAGVPVVDAVGLLGARVVLVGIRPEVA